MFSNVIIVVALAFASSFTDAAVLKKNFIKKVFYITRCESKFMIFFEISY